MARLFSLLALLALWWIGAGLAGPRTLPSPAVVGLALLAEARSGALLFNLGATLARVVVAFVIAMALGSALGLLMGLSLVWKIVLVVELLGRPNGVGFEIGSAFQLFDVTRILAYSLAFVAVMLAIELCLVQPFERHVSRWRPRAA